MPQGMGVQVPPRAPLPSHAADLLPMFLLRRNIRRWVICLLLLGLTRPVTARELGPPAIDIFDAALAKLEADRRALGQWQYHQTLTTHQFDKAGNVVARGTWKSIVRPGDPRPLEFTSKQMEGRLSFFEAESDNVSPESSRKTKPDANATEEKNQAESAVEAVRKYNLRARYNWKRLSDEAMNGENVYVISFTPKPHQNASSREERFFALLAGRLWVNRTDFSVLRAEAALQSPCQLFWLIARVTTFELTYRLDGSGRDSGLLRPSTATAKTVVTFPFVAIRQRHWLTVDRLEPRTPRSDETSAPAAAP